MGILWVWTVSFRWRWKTGEVKLKTQTWGVKRLVAGGLVFLDLKKHENMGFETSQNWPSGDF